MIPIRVYRNGYRHGLLLDTGRKLARVIISDESGIRIRKVPLTNGWEELNYPTHRACKVLLRMGKKFGISREAKEQLTAGSRKDVP